MAELREGLLGDAEGGRRACPGQRGANVVELRPSGLVPLPVFHATQDRDITLVRS
ncbi:DUF6299 family protein [Streptomyces griseoluteus]|uniref:DUF6299 family protein n=1 Tax=Streptomyces griseoluteus TaxID=29306 RepID=UPI0035716236